MPAKYFPIIRKYVLSSSSQRKYNFYHENTLLGAFRTNSRNIIGRNPSMVIPLLANQDLKPMLNTLVHSFIHFYIFRRVTLQQNWFSRGSSLKRKKMHIQGKIQPYNK